MNFPIPERHNLIPENAQYIGGVGAGAWFAINKENELYRIKRYTPEGELTCDNLFKPENDFDITQQYTVTYPSHCLKCTVIQSDKIVTLIAV